MEKSLFISYQLGKIKKPQGQIAALFIVLIAVVFVFMAIVINIGRIGMIKTGLDNAVDGAALAAASIMGSYTNVLNMQVRCVSHWDFGLLGRIIGFIAAVVIMIASFGTMSAISFALATYSLGRYEGQWYFGNPKLDSLSLPDRVTATATGYAFGSIIDDPNRTIDVNDLDQDGKTDDEVPMYAEWWDKHLATLKTNMLVGFDEWKNLMGYTDSNGNFVEGPVSLFEKKIDANFTYPDGTKGQGTPENDYSAYLYPCDLDPCAENPCNTAPGACTSPCHGGDCPGFGCYTIPCSRTQHNGFIPLLADLMARYYIGADTEANDVDDDKFHFDEIRDNVHMTITPVNNCPYSELDYHCGTFGNWPNTQVYLYDGIWTEGRIEDRDDFHPGEGDCQLFDRADEMLSQFNDFLTFVEDLRDAKKFVEMTPEQVLSVFLEPVETRECGNEPLIGRETCKSSYYDMLRDWQVIISDWRAKLITVDNAILSKVEACKQNCANFVCPTLRTSTSCFDLRDACDVVVGNIALASKITANLEYDKNVGDYCLERCSGGNVPYCGCSNHEICWECYSECYGDRYWDLHPYRPNATQPPDPDWQLYGSDCISGSGPCTSRWGRNLTTLPPCDDACALSCDIIYNTVEQSGGTNFWFHDRIQESLQRLGDPNNSNGGGLYWDIQYLLDEMENTYNAIKNIIDSARKRSVYAWKDTQGWHLAMVEVGSFPVPSLYLTKDSSFLGLYKTECIKLAVNGSPYVDVWAWRYDQAKEISLAGKGNLPWWKFQYGRKQNIVEPAFFSDDTKNSWVDLDLLNYNNNTYLHEIECFLCNNGMRSHSKAHYGANQTQINIVDTKWTSPNFCLGCP